MTGGARAAPETGASPRRPALLRRLAAAARLGAWSLRARLVVTAVVMMALISVIIGVLSVLALRNSMMADLDSQLHSTIDRGRAVVLHEMQNFAAPGRPLIGAVVAATGQPTGTFGAYVTDQSITVAYLDPAATTKNVTRNLSTTLTDIPADQGAQTVDLGGGFGDYRLAATRVGPGVLVIGLPVAGVDQTISRLIVTIVVVSLLGLIVLAVAAAMIVRLALSPLERMAAAARKVSELPLDRGEVALGVRMPQKDAQMHTEVGMVAAALNRMLGHIAAALAARQRSEQKVREFVADASHELRTPLASIRGYAELTRRSPQELPADAGRALGRIESEAARMTGLVEDLLLLARLDAGRDLEYGVVDLTSLVIDSVSDAHAAGPGHRFELDLPEEPVEIYGDAARLHQVVVNLLANARVHTPDGTTVTAVVRREDGRAAGAPLAVPHAVVSVVDDGPGIPEPQQARLFERFARGDASRSRATGSTGLGLAIVKAVVDAHHGLVKVSSVPGRTEFTVRLPLDSPPPPPNA
ncbi:MAG TPA: ATP-binding protein [Microbacteriaceae bacterium]|nr:ATP-binding protein [Microbacteriaceae bacterium]